MCVNEYSVCKGGVDDSVRPNYNEYILNINNIIYITNKKREVHINGRKRT